MGQIATFIVYTRSSSKSLFLQRRIYPKFCPASITQLIQVEFLQRRLRLVQI